MADLDQNSDDMDMDRRVRQRRTVLWPAEIALRGYRFKCQVWNMSLEGARIRLDLPLAVGTEGSISVLDREPVSCKISWAEGDSLGLKFLTGPDRIKALFADRPGVLGLISE